MQICTDRPVHIFSLPVTKQTVYCHRNLQTLRRGSAPLPKGKASAEFQLTTVSKKTLCIAFSFCALLCHKRSLCAVELYPETFLKSLAKPELICNLFCNIYIFK